MLGKLHLRLNADTGTIVDKYLEGKLKGALERVEEYRKPYHVMNQLLVFHLMRFP